MRAWVQVAIRAFFPVWVMLYVVQFILWPLIARDNWFASFPSVQLSPLHPPSKPDASLPDRVSLFFGNTLYLIALGYYSVICFLGYNGTSPPCPHPSIPYALTSHPALPFLHHTELLLSPTFLCGILWFASLFGFNIPKHILPLLVLGAR